MGDISCAGLVHKSADRPLFLHRNATIVLVMKSHSRWFFALLVVAIAIVMLPTATRAERSLEHSSFEQSDYEGAFNAGLALAEKGQSDA